MDNFYMTLRMLLLLGFKFKTKKTDKCEFYVFDKKNLEQNNN